MKQGTAIIIGAGPAGLTAAIELQRHTGIKPILIESGSQVGGLSRTVCYKGNRMDIGGHRFFSKSDRVMKWWLDLMPVEEAPAGTAISATRASSAEFLQAGIWIPQTQDLVMLVRNRKSRIYFLRRFFDYPIRLTGDTLKKMGLVRTFRAGFSYMRSALLPAQRASLSRTFSSIGSASSYTSHFLSPTPKRSGEFPATRSAPSGVRNASRGSRLGAWWFISKKTFGRRHAHDIAQKDTETSLIERFLYPKLGPGQLWEHAAELVCKAGGEIHLSNSVDRINVEGNKVVSVECVECSGRKNHGCRRLFLFDNAGPRSDQGAFGARP